MDIVANSNSPLPEKEMCDSIQGTVSKPYNSNKHTKASDSVSMLPKKSHRSSVYLTLPESSTADTSVGGGGMSREASSLLEHMARALSLRGARRQLQKQQRQQELWQQQQQQWQQGVARITTQGGDQTQEEEDDDDEGSEEEVDAFEVMI